MYFLSRHTKSPFKKLKRRKLNTLKKKKKESKEYINSKKKKEKNVVSARLECFTQNGLDKGRRIIGGKKMDQKGMVGAGGYQFYSVVSIGVAEIGRAIFFPARGIFAR